ncbi:hypothetical protein [Sinosporangium siamense]|uniref:Uncharacterized protein n=1 Tax=Sinosporangium siamense TaxID=1367973 RepID=A0A919V5Y0_9ACTN|nr:hypothetical protein [Sinosporangium siamense]GII91366.1 hypothetical protein Ssi02_15970 [Sinosporangium siamense]
MSTSDPTKTYEKHMPSYSNVIVFALLLGAHLFFAMHLLDLQYPLWQAVGTPSLVVLTAGVAARLVLHGTSSFHSAATQMIMFKVGQEMLARQAATAAYQQVPTPNQGRNVM